jgi:hypothetical protein
MLRVRPVVPVVLGAIELSRTRLSDRVVVSCAVDLREVQWRPAEIIDATVTVRDAGGQDGAVRLSAADGPAYVNRRAASVSTGEFPLNAIGLRELTRASGGFFFVDVEMRTPERADAPSLPRIAGLTVHMRAVSSRARAAA